MSPIEILEVMCLQFWKSGKDKDTYVCRDSKEIGMNC